MCGLPIFYLYLPTHQFIHTRKNYLLNFCFVLGIVSNIEETMINMANGPGIQLTVYWGSPICIRSYDNVVRATLERYKEWGVHRGIVLVWEWGKDCKDPFRGDI